MPTATVHVIKGAPEETELAALVAVLHVLSRSVSAAPRCLTARTPRATWTRPRRRSGLAGVMALNYEQY
jgi:hypothetical protein